MADGRCEGRALEEPGHMPCQTRPAVDGINSATPNGNTRNHSRAYMSPSILDKVVL